MIGQGKFIHNALKQIHLQSSCTSINGFSISGLSTYIQFPELDFMIDIGECPLSAISINHVFLTHAHGDHARCLMRHHSLRKMMGVEKESVYYIPNPIVEGAKGWIHAEAMFENVSETKFKYPEIVAVSPLTRTPLKYRKDLVIEPFDVKHTLPTMGGTLYLHKRKLKPEFLGKSSSEIVDLKNRNIEITYEVYEPLLSFMGDCRGESLMDNPSVFKSKILVTECTFLDDEDESMSFHKGHTHIKQIIKALNEFDNEILCEKIILTHFSMKYSEKHIREMIEKHIPEKFKEKIIPFI